MAGGGTIAGVGALMLLGVVWVALYDGRKALVITIGAMALALTLPILVVGSPDYPPVDLRRAAVLVGHRDHHRDLDPALVRRVRERGEEAARGREFVLAVMNSAAEGIVSIDRRPGQYANPAGCALLGYTPAEIRGERLSRAGPPHASRRQPLPASGVPDQRDDGQRHRAGGRRRPLLAQRRNLVPGLLQERRDRQPSDDGVVITFTDISERRRIEEIKDELVSVVSHELRTPLTSIRGSLGLIAGGAVGEIPAEAERMIGIAVTNTDRLVRLINEILDLERIESGRVELSRRLCDSDELMQHAAATMAAQAEAEGTRIEVERMLGAALGRPRPDHADADQPALERGQVLAARTSPCMLRAVRADSEVRFDVIDQRPRDPGRPARERVRALRPGRRLRLAREGRARASGCRSRAASSTSTGGGCGPRAAAGRGHADVVHPAGRRLGPAVAEAREARTACWPW